jgi:hypothetical protein
MTMVHPRTREARAVTNTLTADSFTSRRAALVVGHPGHELRVHGWLEVAHPVVMLLTDGSGSSGRSRVSSTTALLERAGARPGDVYGRFTDAEIYAAILKHDSSLFISLAEELAAIFVRDRIEVLVGDAAEWYNPTHDICRMVIDAAGALAREASGRELASFGFPLVARPDASPENSVQRTICFELDDEALERKLAAARDYVELAREVDAALEAWGADAFRQERLCAVDPDSPTDPGDVQPFYERFGEQRVSDGAYKQVIRYRTHVQPLAEALRERVARARRQ